MSNPNTPALPDTQPPLGEGPPAVLTEGAAANFNVVTRLRLILMMFLEYAVWGAWLPVIGATLGNRGVAPVQIGYVFGAFYLAFLLNPFLGGQIADRVLPSQVFLGVAHLLAAGAAFVMANQTDFNGWLLWLFVWSLLFTPTLGVTNSIVLHQIDRAGAGEEAKEREFSWIRTAGTIGWIVAAFVLLAFLRSTGADPTGKTGPLPEMQVAGWLGIVMGLYSFTLPHTPPVKDPEKRTDPLAFRKAFGLFRLPGFTVFMLISFVAATEFQFYYVLSGQFLESATFTRIPHEYIGPVKSISQAAEILALGVLLPLLLPRKGMRWCLLLGSLAWPLRYFIFAIGQPAWLVVASLGLHGLGYAFVIVVQQLYVDRVSPPDIRASAQILLNVVTLGVGNFLGALISGWVQERFTTKAADGAAVTNWAPVFLVPAVLTLICFFAYQATFRDPERGAAERASA